MILGIGTDIVKTARFKDMTEHFMARVFTPNERAYLLGKSHVSAAGIFAAKEAVAKALGTGFRHFWPSCIEVVHDAMGKPYVVLHGEAAHAAAKLTTGDYEINLSISHTSDDAVAFAVISLKGEVDVSSS